MGIWRIKRSKSENHYRFTNTLHVSIVEAVENRTDHQQAYCVNSVSVFAVAEFWKAQPDFAHGE